MRDTYNPNKQLSVYVETSTGGVNSVAQYVVIVFKYGITYQAGYYCQIPSHTAVKMH